MKIAFLVGEFPLLSETFIFNQIAGAIDRGHEVHIYALNGEPKDLSKVHPIVEKYNLIDRTYYSPTLPKNKISLFFKCIGLFLTNIERSLSAFAPLLKLFQDNPRISTISCLFTWFYKAISLPQTGSYDIIHCQFGTLSSIGLLCREMGLIEGNLITTFRGHDITQIVAKYGERFYDRLFAEGEFFFANCEFFRQRALALGCDENKIVVHGSGIDCSKFTFTSRPTVTDGKVKIATIARLVEKKGIEYGIRAIALLVETHPQIEYNVIGNGVLKPDLEKLIEELNLTNKVKLLGWKKQQEIIEILNNTHIFMAPCVTAADGDRDAPVNTLKEAMAMGLPVVSTYHGGIPELVEDGISGFLVPERDAEALAEKLSYLIEHTEIWSDMAKAGRLRVESKYDFNNLNDELVRIYEQVLKNNNYREEQEQRSIVLNQV
ncbi:MAG: glycosyltransferase [Prochloraceae cyanobacterium]|nr:glycosyltransferase [Prochloraceae cyanobacterium]